MSQTPESVPAQADPTTASAVGTASSPPPAGAITRLQGSSGNHAVARMLGTRGQRQLQREGLGTDVWEWVKEKHKNENEKQLDERLTKGLEQAEKIFRFAQTNSPDKKASVAYGELADKFKDAAKNAKAIEKVKEYVYLFAKFNSALEAATPVDLSRDGAEGAKKLFKLMSVGGEIGKKIFPPPLDTYFDFAAQMKNLENVGTAYNSPPDRRGGPHEERYGEPDTHVGAEKSDLPQTP